MPENKNKQAEHERILKGCDQVIEDLKSKAIKMETMRRGLERDSDFNRFMNLYSSKKDFKESQNGRAQQLTQSINSTNNTISLLLKFQRVTALADEQSKDGAYQDLEKLVGMVKKDMLNATKKPVNDRQIPSTHLKK